MARAARAPSDLPVEAHTPVAMNFLAYAQSYAVKDVHNLARKCIRGAGLDESLWEDAEQEIWIAWSKLKINPSQDKALIVSKAITAGRYAVLDLRRTMQYATSISRDDFYRKKVGSTSSSVEFSTTDSRAEIHTAHDLADPAHLDADEEDDLDHAAGDDSTFDAFDLEDLAIHSKRGSPDAEKLSRILDMLSPASQRVVVDLVYGESLHSCAQRHGVSPKAIQHSIERALKTLGMSDKQ